MAKRVAVIGGGTSGLACIKCCLDEGLEPVCFETSDDIGGLWRFKENPDPDRASIYHSLIINTSKEMMCFSDFPIPAHFPNYMHNSLIMDYFHMYADHFQLKRHICFQTKVLHVTPRPDFPHSGQWDVETESKDGRREKQVFDAVMVCTGHHCHPNLPLQDFPGIDTFKGKFFHSRDYKNPEEWRGKRVVVIGIGNSGGDIAVELSRMAKQVYLSTRRGSWILNRVGDKGVPIDMLFNNRMNVCLSQLLPVGFINHFGEKQLNKRFNHKLYGLQPAHRYVAAQRHTIQVDYIPYMDELAKQVGVCPPILKLLLTDPRLALNIIFGPCTPYQFRLHGPGQWDGARQAILTQWDRVTEPLKTRCTPEPQSQRSSHSLMFSVSAAVLLSALYYSRASLHALIADPSSLLDKIRAFVPLPLTTQ
ncbi:hypothetical protein cypCar_00017379 [Cyprinus carpio]|nr:hypothetical protein cypCar_00017379 [Cyprinus carpio]